jgi:hypothetical protein
MMRSLDVQMALPFVQPAARLLNIFTSLMLIKDGQKLLAILYKQGRCCYNKYEISSIKIIQSRL